jgi:ribonuclease Z
MKRFCLLVAAAIAVAAVYYWGHSDGRAGRPLSLVGEAIAAEASVASGWSPTEPSPSFGVYYPGTEALKPDEIRVIACGSGMPMPRLKQAAACFLIELGNGDKFIFDMGTGAMERLYALGIPLDFIDKVFLAHLHMDHMGDLPAFYIYGLQNNRSKPLRIWGPGGGGTRPEWGTKAALEHVEKTWAWMTVNPPGFSGGRIS